MSDDQDFLDELKDEFLQEAEGLLSECEEVFIEIEEGGNVKNSLDRIFRIVHSMKGTSLAVGLEILGAFSHIFEDYMAALRVHPDKVDQEAISLLLSSVDQLKIGVEYTKAGTEVEWDTKTLAGQLKKAAEDLTNSPSPSIKICEQAPVSTGLPSIAELEAQMKAESLGNVQVQEQAKKSMPSIAELESQIKKEQNEKKSKVGVSLEDESDGDKKSDNSKKVQESTIRVGSSKIESILNLVGELVVLKSQLMQAPTIESSKDEGVYNIVSQLDKTIRELHDQMLTMRLTPLKQTFVKVKRVLRDVSSKLKKEIEVTSYGDDTEIDRAMIGALNDPLVHIARNAADHGIETFEERQSSGKSAVAKIELVAFQSGGCVVIEFRDDGKGICRDRVVSKAIENGLLTKEEAALLSDKEVANLIFAPGFSTAAAVTDISGRGVGLDVVRSNIESIQGSVEVESKEGEGSVFRLSLPLTAAITDGVEIESLSCKFVIPMHSVGEMIQVPKNKIYKLSSGQKMFELRGESLPLISLSQYMGNEGMKAEDGDIPCVVIKGMQENIGVLAVDKILGQRQVVVKPLGSRLQGLQGVSGASILGDGSVALVLEADSLFKWFKSHRSHYQHRATAYGQKEVS